MSDNSKTREAISRAATKWRQQHEKAGIPMTQTQAEQRVKAARERGDRIRENDPSNRNR